MLKFNYKCSNSECDYTYFSGEYSSDGGFVVYSDKGNKLVQPFEDREKMANAISNDLGVSIEIAKAWVNLDYEKIPPDIKKKIDDNTGLLHLFVCINCLTKNYLNEKKDKLICSKCNSIVVVPPKIICPKCKNGKLIRVDNLTS